MKTFKWDGFTYEEKSNTNKIKFVWKLVESTKKTYNAITGVFDLFAELELRINNEDYVNFSKTLFCQEDLTDKNIKFIERNIEKYIKNAFTIAKREGKKVKGTTENEILKLMLYTFVDTVNKEIESKKN